MKQFGLSLILCLLGGICEAKVADVATFKLDNGLEVAVIENHKAPVVLQMLYYKTGSVNDPKGKGGIAHLLEHLMFRGTKKVPDKEFNRLTDEHGAENNAYTTYTETGYYEFSDISKLELMMALEADRMNNLSISDESFRTERDIVLQERLQRFESNPIPLFYEIIHKLIWQEHPLANSVSGSVTEIKSLQKEDAIQFYKKWYGPNNALLVLAGDITPREAKILAKKYYGKIAPNPMVESQEYSPSKAMSANLSMKRKGVEEPRFISAIRLDAHTLSKTENIALNLLAEYLAGDDISYLSERLIYTDKTLLSIDISTSYEDNFGGVVSVYATPAKPIEDFVTFGEMLENAIKEGVKELTTEKLEKIKNRMLSEAIYLQENPESSARFVGNMLLAGFTKEEIEKYDTMTKAITLDDVQKVWNKIISAKVNVNGYLKGE